MKVATALKIVKVKKVKKLTGITKHKNLSMAKACRKVHKTLAVVCKRKQKQRRHRVVPKKVQIDRSKKYRNPKRTKHGRPLPPYTPVHQKTPHGHALGLDRINRKGAVDGAMSFKDIVTMSHGALALKLIGYGWFRDRQGVKCSACHKGTLSCQSALGDVDELLIFKPRNVNGHPEWRCTNRDCRTSVRVTADTVFDGCGRSSFGSVIGAAFCLLNRFHGGSLTARDTEKLSGMSHDAILALWDKMLVLLEKFMVHEQKIIKLTGQCECDEVYPVSYTKKGVPGHVFQMMVFGARVRGDNRSLVLIRGKDVKQKRRIGCIGASPTPPNIKMIDNNLRPFLNTEMYTIMHSDGAGAYTNIDGVKRLSPLGNLHGTQVSHTPKLNATTGRKEIAFTQLRKVAAPGFPPLKRTKTMKAMKFVKRQSTGKAKTILTWGGTQFMDGGFKHMRSAWPANMNHGTEEQRALIMRYIRLFQFRTWFSGHDYMKKWGQVMMS
jgi:hypothetical protein